MARCTIMLCLWIVAVFSVFNSVDGNCRRDPIFTEDIMCSGSDVTEISSTFDPHAKSLYIQYTRIKKINASFLESYPNLERISIFRNTDLTQLPAKMFSKNTKLSLIEIYNNPRLTHIHQSTFDANISGGLRTLDLSDNDLQTMPDLSRLSFFDSTLPLTLNLDGNPLTTPTPLCGLKDVNSPKMTCNFLDVSIQRTRMTYLRRDVLNATSITNLYLGNNRLLEGYDEDALTYLTDGLLEILVLSNNTKLTALPSQGISSIQILKCENCKEIKYIPFTGKYKRIKEVHLTYPQHCCAFRKPQIQDREAYEQDIQDEMYRCKSTPSTTTFKTTPAPMTTTTVMETIVATTTSFFSIQFRSFGGFGKKYQAEDNTKRTQEDDLNDLLNGMDIDQKPVFTNVTLNPLIDHTITYPKNCSEIDFDKIRNDYEKYILDRENLRCVPFENSFTPCVDILEKTHYLRVVLWIVAISAVIGNFIVLCFTFSSRTKTPLTVTKFLICNLAFSDALQGIYLLTLATVDIKTRGEYFNFATWWQLEGGCDIIGFITVFASELSVYTLSIITLERWYAISHAIHLTKRMQLKQAMVIMLIGWLFAIAMAAMPLGGISSYQETSLCLPFRFKEAKDKAYIIGLLAVNVAAFIIVVFCYVSIFQQVRGSNASMASDTHLARRMAALVFTDFICWGPVAIVAGLTAGGVNLQTALLNEKNDLLIAKIILVTFYPFNACVNPFLYALITKQFRKDCFLTLNSCGLCKRKGRPVRRRLKDSVQNRHNNARNSQCHSHMSNSTLLTNTASHTDQTRANSIKSRSSIEALIAHSIQATNGVDTKHESAVCIREYPIKFMDNKTGLAIPQSQRKKRHSLSGGVVQMSYTRSISCSASTIDSTDSRRPSDTVRVPETLVETDSLNYDDQWRERPDTPLTWHPNHNREQWHRDRWLSDERNNKLYYDKVADVDSGTEMNQISESECDEEYSDRLCTQSSVESSCSDHLMSSKRERQGSCTSAGLITHQSSSYGHDSDFHCDSDSVSECDNQYQNDKNSTEQVKIENIKTLDEKHVESSSIQARNRGSVCYHGEEQCVKEFLTNNNT